MYILVILHNTVTYYDYLVKAALVKEYKTKILFVKR